MIRDRRRGVGSHMPDPPKRSHLRWWAVGVLAALIGGMACLRWWESRAVRGLVPEGLSAYDRGDWERSALLARRRLKEVPDDQEALGLAARGMARQDRDQAAISTYSRLGLNLMTAEDYFLLGRALSRTGQDESRLQIVGGGTGPRSRSTEVAR